MLVLFVCFANTCRSPMAEAVLNNLQRKKHLNWTVDSAGTSDMHAGRSPNPNTMAVLQEHDLGSSHVSRQVRVEDFSNFDYILAMDESNLSYLQRIAPEGCRAKVELLGEYRMEGLEKIVVDPYGQGLEAYRRCYNQIFICCQNFIDQKVQTMSEEGDQ